MVANHNPDPKLQATPDNTLAEPEFLDSPFDRWVRLADVIIQKHAHAAAFENAKQQKEKLRNFPN